MPNIFARLRLAAFAILVLAIGSGRMCLAQDSPPHGPRIVMIIRHAEKPDADPTATEKDINLSKRGFERAEALAKALCGEGRADFPRPDFLIATKASKGSNRPVETITPLAAALHEPIESTFKDKEFAEVAHAVLTDPKYAGKTVLIAWHHGTIPDLAKALGVKDPPQKWQDEVFDRVWEITYNNGTASLKNLPEGALPGDSQ